MKLNVSYPANGSQKLIEVRALERIRAQYWTDIAKG